MVTRPPPADPAFDDRVHTIVGALGARHCGKVRWEYLTLLRRRAGHPVSVGAFRTVVYGDDRRDEHLVRVHITQLRHALAATGAHWHIPRGEAVGYTLTRGDPPHA